MPGLTGPARAADEAAMLRADSAALQEELKSMQARLTELESENKK